VESWVVVPSLQEIVSPALASRRISVGVWVMGGFKKKVLCRESKAI
jgi:hypothetical protein